MSMTLQNLEFLRLLPAFMREDAAVQGLSAGLDIIIRSWPSASNTSPHGIRSTISPKPSSTSWRGS